MLRKSKNVILGVESGIGNSNVAICREDKLLGNSSGIENVSKAEDLLWLIERLLLEQSIEKGEIALIVFSNEPGSLTGLRIGSATVKGLRASIKAEVTTVPILDALTALSGGLGKIICALSTSVGTVYTREYELIDDQLKKNSDLQRKVDSEFLAYLKEMSDSGCSLVLHDRLYKILNAEENFHELEKFEKIYSIEGSLAGILARYGALKLCVR